MRFSLAVALLSLACSAVARSAQHVRRRNFQERSPLKRAMQSRSLAPDTFAPNAFAPKNDSGNNAPDPNAYLAPKNAFGNFNMSDMPPMPPDNPKLKSKRENFIIPQNKNTTRRSCDALSIPLQDRFFASILSQTVLLDAIDSFLEFLVQNFLYGGVSNEHYAGLIPVSQKQDEVRKLYYWFTPSLNPQAGDEITIWVRFALHS